MFSSRITLQRNENGTFPLLHYYVLVLTQKFTLFLFLYCQ